jgi:hypothetical protein
MRYYLELLIKAKGMLETVGHVFLQDSIKNDDDKEYSYLNRGNSLPQLTRQTYSKMVQHI